jgi:protein phosphatase PTC7
MERAIEEGIEFVGGKRDDISVLVGVIGERDPSKKLSELTIHT